MPEVAIGPGLVVGDGFRLEKPLGRGGMGQVWLATQLTTQRQRALKLLDPMLANDLRACERFLAEARAPSKIESEHVVEIVGSGMDPKLHIPWLAMELLEGEDLGEAIERRGTYAPAELRKLVAELGHALGAAHAAGIVHRDLKLENVFLAKTKRADGATTVKLLDFGIAAVLADDQTRATVTSAIGTPLWWAPEQMQAGDHVAPYTDVWAFGLLVFYALTGRSYWRAAYDPHPSVAKLVAELFDEPLPPASVRAKEQGHEEPLPPGFDDWFAHCVERNARARFRDASAATAALLPILDRAGERRSGLTAKPFRGSVPPPEPRVRPDAFAPTAAMPVTSDPRTAPAAFAPTAAMPATTAATVRSAMAPGSPFARPPSLRPPSRSTGLLAVILLVVAAVLAGLAAFALGLLPVAPAPPPVHATVVSSGGAASPDAGPLAPPDAGVTVALTPSSEHGGHARHHASDAPPVLEGVHAELSESDPGGTHLAAALAAPTTGEVEPSGPVVELDRVAMTRIVGNSDGGVHHADTCPRGALLVGLVGSSVPHLGRLGALCGRLTVPAGAGRVTVGAPIELPVRGTSGTTSRVVCDDDEVMIGFRGRAGLLVDRLELICATLTRTASGELTVGTMHGSSNAIGGDGGEPFGTVLCADGAVARVAHIRAGDGIDAFRLGCGVPVVR